MDRLAALTGVALFQRPCVQPDPGRARLRSQAKERRDA